MGRSVGGLNGRIISQTKNHLPFSKKKKKNISHPPQAAVFSRLPPIQRRRLLLPSHGTAAAAAAADASTHPPRRPPTTSPYLRRPAPSLPDRHAGEGASRSIVIRRRRPAASPQSLARPLLHSFLPFSQLLLRPSQDLEDALSVRRKEGWLPVQLQQEQGGRHGPLLLRPAGEHIYPWTRRSAT